MKFCFPDIIKHKSSMLMVGASFSGKTFFLAYLLICFLLRGGRVVFFDNSKSFFTTTALLAQKYVDLAKGVLTPCFDPIKELSASKAADFICSLIKPHDGLGDDPSVRSEIVDALQSMESLTDSLRTISGLVNFVMSKGIQNALGLYTAKGGNVMFDSDKDILNFSDTQLFSFDIKGIIDNKPALFQHVLKYIFLRIEEASELDGRPTLIVFDDAGFVFGCEDYFRQMISTGLNNYRKRNIAFIFAFHNISDFETGMRDTLLNACKIKVFTPNPQAVSNEFNRMAYNSIGLNDKQLQLLVKAVPRRDYLVQDAYGKTQVIDLMMKRGSAIRAICGGSDIDSIRLMDELIDKYGLKRAPKKYLKKKGVI